jgi:hypothetical protein
MNLQSSPKTLNWGLALIALASVHLSSVAGQCTDPLVVKGKKFFNSNTGNYFPMKGIDYYPRPNDFDEVTTDAANLFTEDFRHIWERDIAEFQALGVNAIRLYAVNPDLDNDAFMCALQFAGIYVLVGLAATCEGCAITKGAEETCYPTALKDRGQHIINAFSKYPNVIGFDAGNEINLVAPPGEPEVNAACQKKFIRDMRAFISSCSAVMRQIPVGVVLADVERDENALYYGCRTDPNDEFESTQWYGINTYVHCDGTATSIDQLTGYQDLLSDFSRYGLSYPVMLTEFGCLSPSFPTQDGYDAQRTWLQVDALHSSDYREEFVGGFVFEYSTEKVYAEADSPYPFSTYGPGNYGVGYFTPEDCNDIDIPCEYVRFPQFDSLATKYGNVDTSGEPNLSAYTPAAETVPACPATFHLLSEYDWSAVDEVEDRVCWGGGGFTCPNTNCGGATTPQPAPTDSPIIHSSLDTSGGFCMSRTAAIISTTCMLLAFFYA